MSWQAPAVPGPAGGIGVGDGLAGGEARGACDGRDGAGAGEGARDVGGAGLAQAQAAAAGSRTAAAVRRITRKPRSAAVWLLRPAFAAGASRVMIAKLTRRTIRNGNGRGSPVRTSSGCRRG